MDISGLSKVRCKAPPRSWITSVVVLLFVRLFSAMVDASDKMLPRKKLGAACGGGSPVFGCRSSLTKLMDVCAQTQRSIVWPYNLHLDG